MAAWDCTAYPYPIQILQGTGSDTIYRTTQLNIGAGTFQEMWQWTVSSASSPNNYINSLGYNVNDGLAYGLFAPGSWNSPAYLCRFSHEANSQACLCELGATMTGLWWSATITTDGTYYLMASGGRIHKLPNTQSIAFPPSSPAPTSSLSSCGMTEAMGPISMSAIDVSNSGLSTTDMYLAYEVSSTCTTDCYMQVWTRSGSTMQTWNPSGQTVADLIDLEHNSVTYLIGLGKSDGSVLIVKLDGTGGGDAVGFAYSRVVVDYSLAPSGGVRTMDAFGAGYRFGSRIYFSSNTGSGIFEVDRTSLTAVLDRTGADACDFITSQYADSECHAHHAQNTDSS